MIKETLRRAKKVVKRLTMPKILKRIEPCAQGVPRVSACGYDSTVHAFCGTDDEIFAQMDAQKKTLLSGFEKGQKVLIKINLNSALPYPASTEPRVLAEILDMLLAIGITDIAVGDCSSIHDLPTRRTCKKAGIAAIIEGKAKAVYFDEEKWISVPIEGQYLKTMIVPKAIYEADRMIYLANVKTHKHADFSMAMKLGVGLMHPFLRYDLHKEHLPEKAVEIALAVKPDLIFLDARQPFITGGPNVGQTARGNTVFAGTDFLSVDLEGYKLLYKLKEENDCIGNFTKDPFEMRQFAHAAKIFSERAQL